VVLDVNVVKFLGETGIDKMGGVFGKGPSGNVDDAMKRARNGMKPILKDIETTFAKVGRQLKADITSALSGSGVRGQSASGTRVITGIEDSGSGGSAAIRAAGSVMKTKMVGAELAPAAAEGAGGGGALAAGGGAAGGAAAGAAAVLALMNTGINAANARFARGREGVLDADRMSVLYQQMTGMSQLGVSSKYRMPLTNYRLGAGGINTLMNFESQTGISGVQQASSVEAMRTMSGYSLSTGDVTGMMGSLASAPTANRMFMMTGMGLIGPGGKQNSMMSVMQNLVKVAGLTSEDVVKSAMLPGSITRAKLTSMGVPQDMQTQVIQYAQQNLAYKKKGGRGMYDPSNKTSRRLMGVEENFATQVEETQRLETKRDETFYRRQVDNYAHLERQTQSLTRAFGALEDKLSGILGGVASNRIATTIFQGFTGGLGFGGGDPAGPHISGATNKGGGRSDPSRANISVPTYNGMKTLTQIKGMGTFGKLNTQLQDRILRMMADNPNVGFGEGFRSAETQRNEWNRRYKKTSSPTSMDGKENIFWDGSYWEHVSGSDLAPPGRSMHEIGLAADLVGDFDWIRKNAHRYGLQHFGDVNGEPWHVQLAELPRSRSEYEKQGAPLGHSPGALPFDKNSNFGDGLDPRKTSIAFYFGEGLDHPAGRGGVKGGFGTGSISDRMSRSMLNSIFGVSGKSSSVNRLGKVKTSAGTPVSWGSLEGFKHGGTAKSGVDIGRWSSDFLRAIGAPVTLANLEAMSAWIAAEGTSAKFNPLAVISKPTAEAMGGTANLDGWTDFNSHTVKNFANYEQGLKMNVHHIQQHGKGVIKALQSGTSNPYDVISAVEKMVKGWTTDRGITYAARGRLESWGVGTSVGGDPSGLRVSSGGSSGGSMSVIGGHTFNINPNITLNGAGAPQDLHKIAKEVAVLIKREIELQSLRSN
jgi:hypothetical protein